MAQVVGNPNFKYSGVQLSGGVNGPVCIFSGTQNPNSFSDPATTAPVAPTQPGVQVAQFTLGARVTVNIADIGSLFLLAGVGLLVKTAFDASGATAGTWVQVSTP